MLFIVVITGLVRRISDSLIRGVLLADADLCVGFDRAHTRAHVSIPGVLVVVGPPSHNTCVQGLRGCGRFTCLFGA